MKQKKTDERGAGGECKHFIHSRKGYDRPEAAENTPTAIGIAENGPMGLPIST